MAVARVERAFTWIIHDRTSFLGVIRSDERSEESRDPFGRQQS